MPKMMLVVLHDGKAEYREVDHVEQQDGGWVEHPKIREGERAVFVVGSFVPMIVQLDNIAIAHERACRNG